MLETGIENKELGTQFSILSQSTIQNLTAPVLGEWLSFLQCFLKGYLNQVSSDTYGLFFKYRTNSEVDDDTPATLFLEKEDGKREIVQQESATVILGRGDQISNKEITKTFYVHHSHDDFKIQLIRFDGTVELTKTGLTSMLDNPHTVIGEFDSIPDYYGINYGTPLRIKSTSLNYSSVRQFTTQVGTEEKAGVHDEIIVGERLTLAYF